MYAMARIVLVSDNEYTAERITIFDSTIIICPYSTLFFSLRKWEVKNRCEIKSAKGHTQSPGALSLLNILLKCFHKCHEVIKIIVCLGVLLGAEDK